MTAVDQYVLVESLRVVGDGRVSHTELYRSRYADADTAYRILLDRQLRSPARYDANGSHHLAVVRG